MDHVILNEKVFELNKTLEFTERFLGLTLPTIRIEFLYHTSIRFLK